MSGKFKSFFSKIISKIEDELDSSKNKQQKKEEEIKQEEDEKEEEDVYQDNDDQPIEETPQNQQQAQKNQSKEALQIAKNMISKNPPKKQQTRLINKIEGFYYLTEKILFAPFPEDKLIAKIAKYLNEKHANQYIVYNLSEHKYDNSYFNNSVMEYSFPGLPCPPLDVMFMICSSMQSWLNMDPLNVIVLHCQGTKGRSSLIAACFMAYYYHKEFTGSRETLKFICQLQNTTPEELLYPSQMRYLSYFQEVIHGYIPLNKPLILQRIIMNGIPDIESELEEDGQIDTEESNDETLDKNSPGKRVRQKALCAPYIQLFKNGQRLFQSVQKNKFPECFYTKDSCAIFEVGQRVENDILLRFRHFRSNQSRISMFRATVHTSFAANNVIRLTRDELDGAQQNENYPSDFFIDLIFTDARNQSNLLLSGNNLASGINNMSLNQGKKKGLEDYSPEQMNQSDSVTKNMMKNFDFEEEEKKLMEGSKNLENKDDFWISLSQQMQDRNDDEETKKRKFEHKQQQKSLQMESTNTQPISFYDEDKINEIINSHKRFSDPTQFVQNHLSPQRSSDHQQQTNLSLSHQIQSQQASSPASVSSSSSAALKQLYQDSDSSSLRKNSSVNASNLLDDEANESSSDTHSQNAQVQNNAENIIVQGQAPGLQSQLTIEEQQKIQQMIETTPGGDLNGDDDDIDMDNYLDNLENDSD
eukprot:403348134